MKWSGIIAVWLGGIAAAAVLFVLLTLGTIEALALYDTLRPARGVVAEAAEGWVGLEVAIIGLPIIAVLSIAGGVVAGVFLNRKMQPGDASHRAEDNEVAE